MGRLLIKISKGEEMKLKTLSDKIVHNKERLCPWDYLEQEDVKEFIKKLKKDFKESYNDSLFNELKVKIDKLAGPDLI